MSEWKGYKLGDVVRSISDTYKFKTDEKVVFLNTSDILDGKVLSNCLSEARTLPGQAKKRICKGDILFSEIRPANRRFAIIDFDCENYVVSTKLMVLRCNKSIDNRFLYLFLTSSEVLDYLQMIAEDRSGTFPQITFDIIASLDISLPSIDEQKRIASILSSLDDKIDLLNRENATLEAMAETLFRQWFIEEAKEEWEEVTLEDVALLNAGGDKPKIVSQNRTKELNVPIYSNGIDNEGLYGYTDKPRITEESVTISARGTIGFVALRTEPFVPIVRLITIRPKERVTSKFLYFWAKSQDINGTGTTQQQLTVPDLKLTKLMLPDKAVIDDFTKIANQYYDKIISNKKQIQTLIYTRDGLLTRLMSNEIKL